MSLKYTYQHFTSFFLALIIAWNGFGYIGMMIGTLAMHEISHNEDQCEKMFCDCEVSDGQKICVCHHHNEHDMSEENHHGPSDCFLDLNLKDYAHDTTLIQWDNRTFIFYDVLTSNPTFEEYQYSVPPNPEFLQGITKDLDRPPAKV